MSSLPLSPVVKKSLADLLNEVSTNAGPGSEAAVKTPTSQGEPATASMVAGVNNHSSGPTVRSFFSEEEDVTMSNPTDQLSRPSLDLSSICDTDHGSIDHEVTLPQIGENGGPFPIPSILSPQPAQTSMLAASDSQRLPLLQDGLDLQQHGVQQNSNPPSPDRLVASTLHQQENDDMLLDLATPATDGITTKAKGSSKTPTIPKAPKILKEPKAPKTSAPKLKRQSAASAAAAVLEESLLGPPSPVPSIQQPTRASTPARATPARLTASEEATLESESQHLNEAIYGSALSSYMIERLERKKKIEGWWDNKVELENQKTKQRIQAVAHQMSNVAERRDFGIPLPPPGWGQNFSEAPAPHYLYQHPPPVHSDASTSALPQPPHQYPLSTLSLVPIPPQPLPGSGYSSYWDPSTSSVDEQGFDPSTQQAGPSRLPYQPPSLGSFYHSVASSSISQRRSSDSPSKSSVKKKKKSSKSEKAKRQDRDPLDELEALAASSGEDSGDDESDVDLEDEFNAILSSPLKRTSPSRGTNPDDIKDEDDEFENFKSNGIGNSLSKKRKLHDGSAAPSIDNQGVFIQDPNGLGPRGGKPQNRTKQLGVGKGRWTRPSKQEKEAAAAATAAARSVTPGIDGVQMHHVPVPTQQLGSGWSQFEKNGAASPYGSPFAPLKSAYFHNQPIFPNTSQFHPSPAFSTSNFSSPARFSTSPPPEELFLPLSDEPITIEQAIRNYQMVEDAQKRVWAQIVKRDIPKASKLASQSYTSKVSYHKKVSGFCLKEQRRASARMAKSAKDGQVRSKKLMKEMLTFWKRNEKEEREAKKKAEKDTQDRLKKEEEARESKRQARKLNFLISQTEIFSHFVGSKIKTAEAEDSPDTASSGIPVASNSTLPEAATVTADPNGEIDFDADDETNLKAHARANALAAVAAVKNKATAFDTHVAEERKKNEAGNSASKINGDSAITYNGASIDLDSDELNFQNPTAMQDQIEVKQPKMLHAQLKEYQLKGLNWLANLYEQGINGILADEMGLGKTIQSIALMAYLAEVHDIWGPFLVISPASTLHNWYQEISRFVPNLKIMPYWGTVADRATLRKFWNRKKISYNKDAPFHVLITSYQLVVLDEKYFSHMKWQYMILDEAQAIKSSTSARWRTLLGFHCRNRLLLTGTPIQNSMQELWALLHFIMPSLFDSHNEFSEWFSKDIEGAASDTKGGHMDEHQLRRLHMILKPFMLRRIKRNVQNELGEKIEIDILVELSPRQRSMYRALRSRISIAELMERASSNDADGVGSLLNLVMQFRKVCNHPELFERSDVKTPLAFAIFGRTPSLIREGEFLHIAASSRNPIQYELPKMFFDVGESEHTFEESDTYRVKSMMNIWSAEHLSSALQQNSSAFGFLPLIGSSPGEAAQFAKSSPIQRLLREALVDSKLYERSMVAPVSESAAYYESSTSIDPRISPVTFSNSRTELPLLTEIREVVWNSSYLNRDEMRFFVPLAVAPPIMGVASTRRFTNHQEALFSDKISHTALYGVCPSQLDSEAVERALQSTLPLVPLQGLFQISPQSQLPAPSMQMPQVKRLIFDSAKLARLDTLLRDLKPDGHRVLVYFQMTKMMDLVEEYLVFRQYKYLRLDGSSKISDRSAMVTAWQSNPEIFVFLLSTRAGGLGINLTAADTVIFYDSDWNPSNDAQAMDRAHRVGQTKQVTVYRLITKGTIDERILRLARQKKEVQDMVVGQEKPFQEVAKPNEVLSLLLDDDELAESIARRKELEESGATIAAVGKKGKKVGKASWEADGDGDDDFFGSSQPAIPALEDELGGKPRTPTATLTVTPQPGVYTNKFKKNGEPRKKPGRVPGAAAAAKKAKKADLSRLGGVEAMAGDDD